MRQLHAQLLHLLRQRQKVPHGLDGVGGLRLLRHQRQLDRRRRSGAVPAVQEHDQEQEQQEDLGAQVRLQEEGRQGRVSRGGHRLEIQYRAGRPICRKVLKILFWEVPPTDTVTTYCQGRPSQLR